MRVRLGDLVKKLSDGKSAPNSIKMLNEALKRNKNDAGETVNVQKMQTQIHETSTLVQNLCRERSKSGTRTTAAT
jgi:hypothetical protein